MENYEELKLGVGKVDPEGFETEGEAKTIEDQFTYQPPTPNQVEDMMQIRDQAKQLAYTMHHCCPDGRDRETAIQKLREVVMFANASIVLDKGK